MLITKSNPKLRLENNFEQKNAIFYRFLPKFYWAPFNNSVTMTTVDVPWDWLVFRIQAYYIVKVRKFQLPIAYHFSTAEGRTSPWADSAPTPPPACLGLKCAVFRPCNLFLDFPIYVVGMTIQTADAINKLRVLGSIRSIVIKKKRWQSTSVSENDNNIGLITKSFPRSTERSVFWSGWSDISEE